MTSIVGKVLLVSSMLLASLADASETHPLMSSKYWVNAGAFFAARDLDASATGGVDIPRPTPTADFETSFGLDDRPDLFALEFGWQFGENWDLSLQYFDAQRSKSQVLEDTIEWEDVTYEAGIDVSAATEVNVTRVFFSRVFRQGTRQSLRLGLGLHHLETSAEISGEATLADASKEFRKSFVSASFLVPNIGASYRYSPSARWLFNARADWIYADVGDFSGGIWNVAAGASFQLNKHLGIGLNYQLFEIDGEIRENHWTGKLRTRFDGPLIYLTGFW